MAIGMISTEGMSSMITDPIVMIDIECQPLPRGAGHMRLDIEMTGALIALGRGFQSTPGTQALTRDLSSFKIWLTGTELIGKATTEMRLPAAEFMFQVQSVSAEPSGLQRFLPTSGWRLESASSLVSPSLTLCLRTTEWLYRSVAAMMKWP